MNNNELINECNERLDILFDLSGDSGADFVEVAEARENYKNALTALQSRMLEVLTAEFGDLSNYRIDIRHKRPTSHSGGER
jgi:hypothetical protein